MAEHAASYEAKTDQGRLDLKFDVTFDTDKLTRAFAQEPGEEPEATFYAVWGPVGPAGLKLSEQLMLFAKVAERYEEAEEAASLGVQSTKEPRAVEPAPPT